MFFKDIETRVFSPATYTIGQERPRAGKKRKPESGGNKNGSANGGGGGGHNVGGGSINATPIKKRTKRSSTYKSFTLDL